jgi:type I restriction enzyme S subunit
MLNYQTYGRNRSRFSRQNRRRNDNLEQQAQALYKSWFVDFDPFKDGNFVESALGLIPEGWSVGNLLDVAELYDSKRKPLSGMQRSAMKKIYPYYGATSIMDYVDNYIFDGIYLLMGEDGSVVTDDGYPFLQYVGGKFWPNNHAHVIQGKNGYSTEMLHCFLLKKNISEIVTGAVQAKISQGNMKKISLVIAPHEVLNKFAPVIDRIYSKIRAIHSENQQLETMRDTLLPKLMSGELKINEIDC